jgi:uncharacterized protein YkwD
VNFLPRNIVKFLLQSALEKLEAWEDAGHLSPRLWGGLLVGGVIIIVLLAQNNIIFRSATATPDVSAKPRFMADRLLVTTEDYRPVANRPTPISGAVLPLQATVTPIALLAAVTPVPPTPVATPLFIFHTVQKEDNLISIAAEYGITTEALLAANDIRDPTNLPIGEPLLIPPREGLRVPVVLHKIESGDKLLKIAAKYSSSVKDILAANPGLERYSLPVGETIAIPIIFNETKPIIETDDSEEGVYYTVQRGDIPLTIASQFDVPVEVLLSANNIVDPRLLQVGQQLLIPPHEGITLGFPVILYELLESDTLLGIASKYGSSVKDILAINPNLIPSSLEAGQLVAIPIIFDSPKPTPEPGQAVPAAPIEASAPFVDLQQQMVEAVNTERIAQGLPPYEVDDELTTIAEAYARDMVVRDFFSHVTPEGKTLRDRYVEEGLTDAVRVGENIQRNTQPVSKTVQTALQWFMGSRPHRNNILHPHHNRIGIGIVEGPPGWYTFVLDFAQR